MRAAEVAYLKSILPEHYSCDALANGVRCVSRIGIEDDEHWEYIFLAIKNHFANKFSEVYHSVSTNHINFIVYLK